MNILTSNPRDLRATNQSNYTLTAILTVAYIGTIAAANWAISHYGQIAVGFGLVAPAGVYAAGLAFTLRDLLQEVAGRIWVLAAIAAGSALSVPVAIHFAQPIPGFPSPWRIAAASATAFALSELADFAAYQPLRRRNWLTAVAASNAAGLVVDSALFLWLAFGGLQFLPGQVIGKAWMTFAAILVLAVGRAAYRRRKAMA